MPRTIAMTRAEDYLALGLSSAGFSARQIAKALGVTDKTVTEAIRRARQGNYLTHEVDRMAAEVTRLFYTEIPDLPAVAESAAVVEGFAEWLRVGRDAGYLTVLAVLHRRS